MIEQSGSMIKPVVVPIGRGAGWLFDGFRYFKQSMLHWISVTTIFTILILVMVVLPIVIIILPPLVGGLMTGCKEQDIGGGQFNTGHMFTGLKTHPWPLLAIGLIHFFGLVIINLICWFIGSYYFDWAELTQAINTLQIDILIANINALLLINLIGLALYLPLIMAVWFAPALVVLNDVSPIDSIKLSFTGCLLNVLPFLLYGVVGLVLSILALIPFGLGLFILCPMITASIYISWKEIYQ